jgi:hypothetical protein
LPLQVILGYSKGQLTLNVYIRSASGVIGFRVSKVDVVRTKKEAHTLPIEGAGPPHTSGTCFGLVENSHCLQSPALSSLCSS